MSNAGCPHYWTAYLLDKARLRKKGVEVWRCHRCLTAVKVPIGAGPPSPDKVGEWSGLVWRRDGDGVWVRERSIILNVKPRLTQSCR